MALITPKQAAKELGVSVQTLRRWVDEGRLAEHRTAGGHRRYDLDELRRLAAREQLTDAAGLVAVADPDRPPPGIIPLGTIERPGDGARVVGMRNEDLDHHLFYCGRTGSGKSQMMKRQIVAVARAGAPLFLVDPHGALADATLDALIAHVPERADDILLIDFGDDEHPVAFNPLDVADAVEIDSAVEAVMAGLDKGVGDAPRARNQVQLALWALCEANLRLPAKKANVGHLITFFLDDEFRHLVVACSTSPAVSEMFDPGLGLYSQLADQVRVERLQPVLRALQPLMNSRTFSTTVLCGRDRLDFAAFAAERKIVLVKLARLAHQTLNGELLGTIALSRLLDDLVAWSAPSGGARVFIEEAAALIGPQSPLLGLMSEARKRDIGLILSSQEPEMFDDSVLRATLANTTSKLSLSLDYDAAELIARSVSQGSPLIDAGDIAALPYFSFYGNVMVGDGDRLLSGPFRARALPPLEVTLDSEQQARRLAIVAASQELVAARASDQADLEVLKADMAAIAAGSAGRESAGGIVFRHEQGFGTTLPLADHGKYPPMIGTAVAAGEPRRWRVRLTFAAGNEGRGRSDAVELALPEGPLAFAGAQSILEGDCYGATFAGAAAALLAALADRELPELIRLEQVV